jgi:peptidoglycan-associated lipoprotein
MKNQFGQSTISAKLVMALAISFLLVACKSTPMTKAPIEDKSGGSSSSTSSSSTTGTDTSGSDTGTIKEAQIDSSTSAGNGSELTDPNNILSKRAIYFDYNSDAVKAEYRPIVEAHAKYLLAHKDTKVIVQGNTDERGTREYNLSLGQRRAVSVKKSLNLLGVQDTQIETVSYGEEKATQNCSDETCDKDRRAVIVYENE